jgi:hypothetical protein
MATVPTQSPSCHDALFESAHVHLKTRLPVIVALPWPGAAGAVLAQVYLGVGTGLGCGMGKK